MAIEIKEKDQLIQECIEKLRDKLPENVNLQDGSILRTLLEVFMDELDKQYWQLEQVYDNSFIDTAHDEDLNNLVAILGIKREPAKFSRGEVVFFRRTEADRDYVIPRYTMVETYLDKNGSSVKFQTIEESVILKGKTEAKALIECIEEGIKGNVQIGTIANINNPVIGIEGVKNTSPTTGGEEMETDENLRKRAKEELDTKGLATILSLYNKIKSVAGVKQVSVIDMARGIGTVDILVLTDTIPMADFKKEEIKEVIFNTKSGGIDVLLLEPILVSVNVSGKIVMEEGYDIPVDEVEEAIKKYVNNLGIGQKLIKNQLERSILNSNDKIIDVELDKPESNIIINDREIIRVGKITIE